MHRPARALVVALALLGMSSGCTETSAPTSHEAAEPTPVSPPAPAKATSPAARTPAESAPVSTPLEPELATTVEPAPSPHPESPPRWRVRTPTATITGGYEKLWLQRVLARHGNELRACARKGRREGQVTLEFMINDRGAQYPRVVSSSASPQVGACIASALRAWSLPRPFCAPVLVRQTFEIIRQDP